MKRLTIYIFIIVAVIASSAMASTVVSPDTPGRRITPVAPAKGINENKSDDKLDMSRVKEVTDANGNTVLVDTVSGKEVVDSTLILPKVIGNIYPLFNGITIGVNVYDAAMHALGQNYGIGSVKAQVSLHNRYMPFFEAGISTASYTPDGNNYTFKSPLAPYFKIGGGYNIFYNSNPDYQLCFNLAYGFSAFRYRYDNVTIDEGYWRDPSYLNLSSQTSVAGYLELGASLKVKIAGPVSAGWSVAYHASLHETKGKYGPAVIIPGYGKRNGAFSIGVFVMYDLPVNKRRDEAVDLSEPNNPEL